MLWGVGEGVDGCAGEGDGEGVDPPPECVPVFTGYCPLVSGGGRLSDVEVVATAGAEVAGARPSCLKSALSVSTPLERSQMPRAPRTTSGIRRRRDQEEEGGFPAPGSWYEEVKDGSGCESVGRWESSARARAPLMSSGEWPRATSSVLIWSGVAPAARREEMRDERG